MAAVTGMGRADRLASHAEAELYERHSRGIFGYCLSRLGAREDAEDATQLTFLHAVRGLRRGVVPTAESAWLFGIARNVCLSRWASAGRRSRVETACDPSALERLTSAHDPRRDELIGLERALELLPEQQRRAVLLRDWRGLSYEEVAAQLGVSHAAVETLIFRGRAALAEHLSEQPSEPRRRLHSLGGLWSLVDAIKGAFTGAAAGAKVAAAVGAAVAVSGGAIALGTTPTRTPAAKPAHPVSKLVPATAVERTAPMPVKERASTNVVPARASEAVPDGAVAAASATPAVEAFDPPAPADAPTPGAAPEAKPEAGAGPGVDPPAAAPATAVEATPSVAAPKVDAPAVDAPSLDVPSAPAIDVPSTDGVVGATEPVTTVVTVVTETVASVPLPKVPEVETALPPLPPLPPPPALPALPPAPVVPVTVPSLP